MSEPPPPSHQIPSSSAAIAHFESQPPSVWAREYRKGNWTAQETLTLITAKRLDDERRSSSKFSVAGGATLRSAEQRWKWVENYCWAHDCLRSQNQCNDKWDNLLRDYKKVRDFESSSDPNRPPSSYWTMDRHQRKERNLPTNLSFEVYQALTDVFNRRSARRGSSSLPPPPPPQPAAQQAEPSAQPSVSAEVPESDESELGEPDAKRRKLKSLGSSVVRGASVLARTLMACEEKREQRHRELLELEERRVKLEVERTEMNRQAVSGLISAFDGLSNAIHALVSGHRNGEGLQVDIFKRGPQYRTVEIDGRSPSH